MDWFVQLVGFLGLAMSIGSYQFKKYRHIILCKTLSELTFAVQYLLLGAWTAAALETLSVIRNLLFCHREKKNQSTTPVILVFAVFVVVIGLVTYAGPISLLPMAAKLLTTVSYGITKEKWLRVLSLPSSIFWVIYNLFVGSIAGALSDSITLVSLLIAMYKFDWKRTPNKNRTH